jgi:CHAT domain-containing protein/Tfp pilus assembly protein PilF
MRPRLALSPARAIALLLAVAASPVRPQLPPHAIAQPSGAVVEQVLGRWNSANGLKPGDIILTWRRDANPPIYPAPAGGAIRTSQDLRDVELEEAPKGTVVLGGLRDGGGFAWTVPAGQWAVIARPALPDTLLLLHTEALGHQQGGRLNDAVVLWRQAAAAAKQQGLATLESWFLTRVAGEFANRANWAEADPAFSVALNSIPDSEAIRRCRVLTTWGRTFEARGAWDEALARYSQALALRRTVTPVSLETASLSHLMAGVNSNGGRLDAAAPLLDDARMIREKLAPGSLELADTLSALGMLASRQRDLDRAASYITESLAIQNRLVPDSLTVAWTTNMLGAIAAWKGDLATAERRFERALEIRQTLAPGGRDVVTSLMNLGGIMRDRGDIASAESYFERALAVAENAPGMLPLDLAPLLQNIGNVAADRGDYARAEEYTRRALDIRLKLAPESLDTALSLGSLGVIAWSRGDAQGSSDYHRRALAIQQKLAPKSSDTAMTLSNLGMVAWKSGDLQTAQASFDDALAILKNDQVFAVQYGTTLMNRGLVPLSAGNVADAEGYFTRALEVLEGAVSGSLASSMALNNLGDLASRRGELDRAVTYHRQALELRKILAPSSSAEAESYHALGTIERRRKALPEAAALFTQALASLEAQGARLGGSQDVQSGFSGGFTQYYQDLAETLVDLGRPAEAFAVIERSRARTLLAILAQRDLTFANVPVDLMRAYQRNRTETDRVYARLSGLSSRRDAAEIQTLLGQLRSLRDDREALAGQARDATARFAELQFPRPLDLSAAVAGLDPGTVALAYSIGKRRSFLYVLQAPTTASSSGLSVFELKIDDQALRAKVRAFRDAITPVLDSGPPAESLNKQATELYDLLIRPAEQLVARSQRVVLVPDGPLHSLPFAALTPSRRVAGPARYLVEWKPLHLVVSTTVYGELRKGRRSSPTITPGGPTLVAFGDPFYSSEVTTPAGTQPRDNSARRQLIFSPLPATRQEVQRIGARFPKSAAVHLGTDATEQRAKTLPPSTRYLHFAVHGFIDSRFPLNSALVLSTPDRNGNSTDNGLLQVWEVFEQMRINADLVTLSACETALGEELGGEGLLGLTRAFHYAGARSVVASLWSVDDDSTAELMTRFYGHLTSGKSKDDALRAAQLEMIRGADQSAGARRFVHPFHWAAFQVFGDWR